MSMKSIRVIAPSLPALNDGQAQFFRVRCSTLELPPVRDGVVIGRASPVSAETLVEAMKLTTTDSFRIMPVNDDIVSAIAIRESLLKKLDPIVVVDFVLSRIKQYMSDSEVLRLDFELETLIEGAV